MTRKIKKKSFDALLQPFRNKRDELWTFAFCRDVAVMVLAQDFLVDLSRLLGQSILGNSDVFISFLVTFRLNAWNKHKKANIFLQ